jgi:Tol biopolymer transport system component
LVRIGWGKALKRGGLQARRGALRASLLLACSLLVGASSAQPAETRAGARCFRGLSEIYVAKVDGTGEAKLTSKNPADRSPAWSPDSTRIAFERSGKILVMNADGSDKTQLTRDNPPADHSPDWSPDGAKIVFERAGAIFVMNTDGSAKTQLTNETPAGDHSPDWSPDGGRITFARSGDIYVMNADGSGQTNLTLSPGLDDAPAWSPDGAKIAFTSVVAFRQDIYVMNADGTDQTVLSNGYDGYWPAWSPDGVKIAFTFFGPATIIITNLDGSGTTKFRIGGYEPAWSLDGTKIAFALVTSDFGIGAKQCRVPRVVGLRLPTARTRIWRSACLPGRTRYVQSRQPRWRVIRQDPRPGVVRQRGWCVDLVVSRGHK